MKRFLIFTCGLSALLSMSAMSADIDTLDIAGTWFTQGQSAKVEVTDCGDNTPCGKLVWFDPAKGGESKDINNPDPALQDRELLGSAVFWGFKPKKNKWSSGKIYDAESGKTYKSKLALQNDGTLKVKGCIGPICQGQIWVRVPSDVSKD